MTFWRRLTGSAQRRLRRLAKSPPVRRPLTAILGTAYAARMRNRGPEERWTRASHWEVAHWRDWLADPESRVLLDPTRELRDPLVVEAVRQSAGPLVRIVDVGAGPLSPLAGQVPGYSIELVATDALAHSYDKLLHDAGVVPPVRTRAVRGEELALTFPADSFDIVHCANALDHCYDPLAVLDNMLVIARQGGRLLLSHLVDEGEAQRYLGLHQWNLRQDNRHLILWNRVTRCDVTDHLRDRAVVECRSTVRRSRPHVECVIIKS